MSRAESQAQTRAAILDAAAQVFAERGFVGASVEAITEAAGYSRGAFYSNFQSKEQLFAELLQARVYARYREMAAPQPGKKPPVSLRELGEQLAAIQADTGSRWLFQLWLELLAHAGRDPDFLKLAADFWRGTREMGAAGLAQAYEAAGTVPPIPVREIASAMIALDIGLALQHFVDPDGAPLAQYPRLYETLFSPLAPKPASRRRRAQTD
ncbi:MAG: TetR family transcriptional regulator [Solirubrobacterales bacterium]|nr:TetR family transcriptional regulator [Solirubrobacterales bacterium]